MNRAHARRTIALAGAIAATVLAAPADARVYPVTKGHGNGPGSLRAAIELADAHRGRDRIVISRSAPARIRLERSIRVNDSVAIVGRPEGTTIVGSSAFDRRMRFYSPDDDDRFSLRDLTLRLVPLEVWAPVTLRESALVGPGAENDKGWAVDLLAPERGLTLRDSRVTGWPYGVMSVGGDVRLRNSELSDNGFALQIGSGTRGVTNLRIASSTLTDNIGALQVGDDVRGTVLDTLIADNGRARQLGGGVSTGARSILSIQRSTIAGNVARAGGGIAVMRGSAVSLFNSTVSGNSAVGVKPGTGIGGGIYVEQQQGPSGPEGRALHLRGSTVTGNSATIDGGGLFALAPQPAFLISSVVAGNEAPSGAECATRPTRSPLSGGGNVFGLGGCGTADTSDHLVADPLLGPLADNGGETPTHALLDGSPAIDNGKDAGLASDQRGVARDADPDSGAYERR